MVRLSLSLGISTALAISLCCSSSLPLSSAKSSLRLPLSPQPCPPRIAADLLSVLSTGRESAAIEKGVAAEIWSRLKFLVPYSPPNRNILRLRSEIRAREKDELIHWPPDSVMDLARIAVDSGGDPEAIQSALDPTVLQIPDVEGLKEDRCELTRTPYGRRFMNEELNAYLAFLFELIAERSPLVGVNITLNRYDLFHGHIFLATDTGRLGILFHAKEYPAYEKNTFPINMGYCQAGSSLPYDDALNLRNILWLAPLPSKQTKSWLTPGALVVLDASPDGIIYDCLVPEYVNYVRTVYEDDLGDNVADVNYFNIANAPSSQRIFIC